MSRIGCLSIPAVGHIGPLSTLARELIRRGHGVTYFQVPDYEHAIRSRDIHYCQVGARRFPLGTVAARDRIARRLSGVAASIHLSKNTRQYSDALLEEAPEAIRQAGIECLLVDQADYAAGTLAQALGIPYVTVSLCLILNEEPGLPPWSPELPSDDPGQQHRMRTWRSFERFLGQPIDACIAAHRRRLGLPPLRHRSAVWSTLAQITQQPPEFEFPRRMLPECFHFTGPFHNLASRPHVPFDFGRLNGKPLIYAAFGTLVNCGRRMIAAVAEACAGLDAQLVISLGGGGAPEDLPPLPGDPIVVGYAPQLELLSRAALMITHAGLNSALECLARGVPMVALPVTNDEPGVAARIAWCGAGVAVPLPQVTPSRIRLAVQQVLGNPVYRTAAGRMRDAIRSANGLGRAAGIVEQVAATGQPVLASRGACV